MKRQKVVRNEYEIVRTIPANQFLSKGRESVSDNNFGSMHGDIFGFENFVSVWPQ